MRTDRRRVLAVLSGSVVALAGCTSSPDTPAAEPTDTPTESSMDTPTETPTDTPTDTPTGTATDTPTESSMDTPTETASSSGAQVTVGPGGSLSFNPASVTISAGETVEWVWDSSNHNVVPDQIPAESSWGGTAGGAGDLYMSGHTYSYTFEVAGEYTYYCAPHRSAGMTGSITVE